MNSKPFYYTFLCFLYLLFGALIFLMATSSCNVIKAKKTLHSDSTHVAHLDSGNVKKSSTAETTTADWWRRTVLFNPPVTIKNGSDTTIINYVYSGRAGAKSGPNDQASGLNAFDYNRLAAIITEKGNYSKQTNSNNYDSGWRKSFDSLKVAVNERTKNKTEKPNIVGQIIIGAVFAFLFVSLLIKKT